MSVRSLITRRRLIITGLFVLILVLVWVNLLIPTQQSQSPNPSPLVINKQGDTILYEDNDFQIVWLAQTNSYAISILSSPFADTRTRAEQKFIELLGKSQPELCQLEVTISTPMFANPY